jgi:hypothetical protein
MPPTVADGNDQKFKNIADYYKFKDAHMTALRHITSEQRSPEGNNGF